MPTTRLTLLPALLLLILLSGCGDTGPISTLMGRDDYTFTVHGNWESRNDDVLDGLIGACISTFKGSDWVVEHMVVDMKRLPDTPLFLIISSNRGGPYSPAQMREQFKQYLARPRVNTPISVIDYPDFDNHRFREDSYQEDTVTITQRIYTKKGYITASCVCPVNDQQAIEDVERIIESITVNPEIAYN